MNNGADYIGRRNDRMATNILPDGGAGSDRGNAPGRDCDDVSLHRGRTGLEAKDGIGPGLQPGPEHSAGNSPRPPGNLSGNGRNGAEAAADLARIPESVRASVISRQIGRASCRERV